MVLKCIFSAPYGKRRDLIESLRNLSPLSQDVLRKDVYTTYMDEEGRTSITILYEFDEFRLKEVSPKILKQIDAFRGIPGFTFTTQVWSDTDRAIRSMAGVA